MSSLLTPAFLEALPPPERARLSDDPSLDGELDNGWNGARALWPGVALAPERFARMLAGRLPAGAAPAALGGLHLEDLYLACACVESVPAALAAFERDLMGKVETFVAHLRLNTHELDDLRQTLRERLLLKTASNPPRLLEYSGRGPLGAWIRVVALREALQLRRKRPAPVPENLPEAGGADPELAAAQRQYQTEFGEALRAVLEGLADREQAVLRMHFLDGLSIDEIGAAYSVHRATAARWIARARADILAGTRERLLHKLRLTGGEFESALGLLSSQLDVSIERFLRRSKVPPS